MLLENKNRDLSCRNIEIPGPHFNTMSLFHRPATGFEEQRSSLVRSLRQRGYVRTETVRRAMLGIPRERFVPERSRGDSYRDSPLSIGLGQTISAPHMVAIMSEALEIVGGEKVLEIGTGSGYHAAVTAELVGEEGHVFSVERHEGLADSAMKALEECGLAHRVTVIKGDGSVGLPGEAPFDHIYVTCAAPIVPPPLLEQLAPGGIMLVPEGRGHYQELIRYRKTGGKMEPGWGNEKEREGTEMGGMGRKDMGREAMGRKDMERKDIERENLGGVAFVPLVGKHGFR